MARRLIAAPLIAAAATLSLAACDSVRGLGPDNCDIRVEEVTPRTYAEGTVEDGVYMSSPWEGELVYFPAGAVMIVEHQLGVVPRTIGVWVALDDPSGAGGAGLSTGPLAPAAGNQGELIDVNATSLTVHNATCANYWLLVTAAAGS